MSGEIRNTADLSKRYGEMIDEVKRVCQQHNSPAVNVGCHSLACRILAILDPPQEAKS